MSAPFGGGPLRIITADERLREARGIKGVLTGTSGIGKTTQLLTLDPQRTLFLNLEAGELAVQGWPGDEIRIRDWEVARDERATVDDIEFALVALARQQSELYRLTSALGDVLKMARRQGACGADIAISAAVRDLESGK